MGRAPKIVGAGLLLGVLLGAALLLPAARAQTTTVCFTETSLCVGDPYRSLWSQGGLATFGFPLSPPSLPSTPGPASELQWFERHRIERHPANPAPYSLLLGRVGAERLAQLGRDWRAEPPATPQTGCRFFPETGRNLCPPFLAAWRASGVELDGRVGVSEAESLALFGLPLTTAQVEPVEGRPYTVQWFERARFELHEDGGVGRVLFGRLGAELVANGAAAGAALTPTPEGTPAPTATGGQAVATSTPRPQATPTATRAPRRPTSTPEDEPEATSTLEPSSTSAPQPTNTRQPTATPVPPTVTPVPPSPTTKPDPYDAPATPPPDFNDSGGLPSASVGATPLEEYDAATDTGFVGGLFCFQVDQPVGAPVFNGSQTFTVTTELGALVETGSVLLDTDTSSVLWRWVPGIDYQPGVYRISTAVSPTLTISGTLRLERRTPAFGRNLVVERADTAVNLDDFNNCNDTIFGAPGDDFGMMMSGFQPNEQVPLHLYGTPGCVTTYPACYRGLLATVTTDANGQAYLPLPTLPTYPKGGYIILTEEQAKAELVDNGVLQFQAIWYQRLNLR